MTRHRGPVSKQQRTGRAGLRLVGDVPQEIGRSSGIELLEAVCVIGSKPELT